MPATIGVATMFQSLRIVGSVGANAPIMRVIEKAAQTFLIGTPVQLDLTLGAVQACPAITSAATAQIYGMSCDYAANLALTGVPQHLNQPGNPPNQPQAVFTPVGAWPNDGTCGVVRAVSENVFLGKLGNSVDGTQAILQFSDRGQTYGLTQDAQTLMWYVDKGITAVASGACVQITDLVDPVGTLNGKVGFVVTRAAQQVV